MGVAIAAGMVVPPELSCKTKPEGSIRLRTGHGKTFVSQLTAKLYVG
jgi:hypothetical protein